MLATFFHISHIIITAASTSLNNSKRIGKWDYGRLQ